MAELNLERWRRLDELFNAAVDLPGDEQSAFVARETLHDAELGRQLAGMLAHGTTAADRISGAIGAVAEAVDLPAMWIGRRFGAYRVVREIGRGGMGLVFEAVRDDDEYRKRVALKVAPWCRDAAIVVGRFKIERQILAGLEHPYIARLLDGGTAHGVPYFVMEYVEGAPITGYCVTHQLDVRRRIDLFLRVCAAVRFAHENLVVHRDLKPANILVGGDGEPKLLDFGIAKLMDVGVDGAGTLTGDVAWTPDYTSPEQVRGRPITVRTDVYSLGLILYELLTGHRAQVSDSSTPLALDRSICEIEPPPPSERAGAAGDRPLARELRGDLDTIVQTAIRKESERRYDSVAALADDLSRYLGGRPIVARASTVRYRATKFARRHRAGVAAAALVFVSIAAGVVATIHQARRAERRFEQVRSLANAFVFDVHDRIEALPGSTEARKVIVQTALTYLESLRSDVGPDRTLALELASAYEKIGNVQGNPLRTNLGDTAGSLASFTRAEDLLRPAAASGDRAARRQLASVLLRIATVRRAQGDRQGAGAYFIRARDAAEGVLAEEPRNREALIIAGEIHADLGRAQFELRNHAAAEASGLRSMEIAQRLVELDPNNRGNQNNLSMAYSVLGAIHISAGRLAEAADSYRHVIAICERLVQEEPNNTEYRRNLLVGYGSLGDVLGYRPGENLGDLAGAIAAFERAVEIAELTRAKDRLDQRALFDVASAKLRLGTLLADAGRRDEALRAFGEAGRSNGALLAREPGSDRYGYVAIVIDRRLGDTLASMDRWPEAIERLQVVRAAAPALLAGPTGPNAREQLILATSKLALLYAKTGDARAAGLATWVKTELSKKPIGNPALETIIQLDLDGADALTKR